jgi:thiol-disulfide isomerase/thioredoxin
MRKYALAVVFPPVYIMIKPQIIVVGFLVSILILLPFNAFAQKRKPVVRKKVAVIWPKVTVVNPVELKNILKPNGKLLLVNFWATWCDPCREEFPDLVKISNDYAGQLDFITVSLDDFDDLKVAVPKFLAKMKTKSPAYLLKTDDEDAFIGEISKDWQGGLPFTLLYNSEGKIVYSRQGTIKPETLRTEIDKNLNSNKIETQINPK